MMMMMMMMMMQDICLSVCLSHAGILSKRFNISSNFFTVGQPHHCSFCITKHCNIPTGVNGGVECRGIKKIANFDQYLAIFKQEAQLLMG